MQMRIAFIMLGMIVFLFSCAHRQMNLPEPAPSPENASQVYIIRDSRFLGFGIPLTVMFNDAIICSLQAGEYVTFVVEPGIHTLGIANAIATVPFQDRRNYYFLITTTTEKFGFEIERIDDERGNYFVSISNVLE